MHPHRGFETITYMMHGAFKHEDTHGHSGVINEGDVQWMTAGRGVIHSEMPHADGDNYGLQLWSNLKSSDKMIPAQYQEYENSKLPQFKDNDVKLTLIAGESQFLKEKQASTTTSPIVLHNPALYEDVILLNTDATFEEKLPQDFQGLIYVFHGSIKVKTSDGQTKELKEKDSGFFKADTEAERYINVCCSTPNIHSNQTRFMIIAGKPIREPVARYGPFVMNTEKELHQAFMDYQLGKLVSK